MAGYDFSQISDEQLEAIMADLLRDPVASATMPADRRQATVAEYNRRRGAKAAAPKPAPATNVDANLEAAATPIETEPVAGDPRAPVPFRLASDKTILRGHFGPGGIPTEAPARIPVREDELDEYGARFRGAIGNKIDRGVAARQAARAAGYEDPEQIAYNEATGVVYDRPAAGQMQGPIPMDPNDPSTWDAGYDDYVQRNTPAEPTNSVERVDRYFADKKRPPLQSRDEFVGNLSTDYNKRRGEAQLAAEGSGVNRTPEQRATRQQRMATEATAAGSDRRVYAMLARMAARAGVTVEEAQAIWDQAGINTKDGLTPDEIFQGTNALRAKATNRQIASRQQQQDNILLKRLQRYNPAAALGDAQGLNDWQKFAMAGGRGATPLDRDAAGAQNAMKFMTAEGLAGQDPLRRQAAADAAALGAAKAEEDLPPETHAARERQRNGGTLPATSSAGKRMLAQIETDVIGLYATQEEVHAAVRKAVDAGIPQADAEAHFARRRSWSNWFNGMGVTPPPPAAAGAGEPAIVPGSVPPV